MYELTELGFAPFFEEQIKCAESIPARIASEHRGGYEVWTSLGAYMARLSGRLIHDLNGDALAGVGDWVTLKADVEEGQIAIIDRILERRTLFTRGAAGREARNQVIAANVNIVFIVCGLDTDYNLRRIERYLARVYASGASPVVILNKADLIDNVEEKIIEVEETCIGVPVLAMSALKKNGVDDLRKFLKRGFTAAFVGSSGTGKSTLINALLEESLMKTGDVREGDRKGRHTTTHRQLILLPQGGLLIDTPGMREMQMVDDNGLDEVFSDIETLALKCRFRDCTHQTEPGCAVLAAVSSGELKRERLDHYRKLEAEAKANEIRHNKRRKHESERAFGKMVKQVKTLKGDKRSS